MLGALGTNDVVGIAVGVNAAEVTLNSFDSATMLENGFDALSALESDTKLVSQSFFQETN